MNHFQEDDEEEDMHRKFRSGDERFQNGKRKGGGVGGFGESREEGGGGGGETKQIATEEEQGRFLTLRPLLKRERAEFFDVMASFVSGIPPIGLRRLSLQRARRAKPEFLLPDVIYCDISTID